MSAPALDLEHDGPHRLGEAPAPVVSCPIQPHASGPSVAQPRLLAADTIWIDSPRLDRAVEAAGHLRPSKVRRARPPLSCPRPTLVGIDVLQDIVDVESVSGDALFFC